MFVFQVAPQEGFHLVDCPKVTATPKSLCHPVSSVWAERCPSYDSAEVTEKMIQPNSFVCDRPDHS